MSTPTARRHERRLDVTLGPLRRPLFVLAELDGEPASALVRQAVRRLIRERADEIAEADSREIEEQGSS
jgi:hypothetical protein